MNFLRIIPLALLCIGYAVLGVIGTRTQMVFQWPSYVLFGLAALLAIVTYGRRFKAVPGGCCLVSMLLLTGYVVARAALSPVPYFGRMDIAMVLAAAIFYVLFALCFPRTRYRGVFIGLLLALVVANLIVGLYQIFRDPSYMVLPGYSRPPQPGAGGFYRNHNHLGGFLLFGSSFAIALSLFGKVGAKTRVVLLFMVPVCLAGIASTASRGAMLSLGVVVLGTLALGLYLAARLYKYEFKKIAIAASVVFAVALAATGYLGVKFLSERSGIGTETGDGIADVGRGSDGRLLMWSLAIDQWQENPVFGQGSRMYDIYSAEYWPASRRKEHGDAEFAHNDYLQLLGEYGAVGIGLMAFFILSHVVSGLRYLSHYRSGEFSERQSRSDNSMAQCLGALLVLLGLGVHSVLDFNLHLPANLFPMAFAFGILANPSGRSAWRSSPPWWLLNATKVALPACGVALLVAAYFYLPGEWHYEKARQVPIADYAEVIAHVDRSLEHDRGNFNTHTLRGTALMLFGFDFEILREGLMVRAVASFEDALEANPYDIFALVGMGRCYDELKEPEKAEEYFIKATTIGIRSREAHLRYAFHFVNIGLDQVEDNLVGAMESFEKGEEELYRAWNSNEELTRESREYQELTNVRRYLSYVYETHGDRVVAASEVLRDEGDSMSERSYLESGLDYFSRARAGAPERRPVLNEKRQRIFDRLKELSDGR